MKKEDCKQYACLNHYGLQKGKIHYADHPRGCKLDNPGIYNFADDCWGCDDERYLGDQKIKHPNFKKLSEVMAEYDGFTTCHGYCTTILFDLIAEGKMELADELAGLIAKTQEQGGWLDEDNDLIEDIRKRAGY